MPLVTLLRNALPVIDSGAQRACLLCLFRQLPDRHGPRHHRRCGCQPLEQDRRGGRDAQDARPDRRALWLEARLDRGRYGLRVFRHSGLAGTKAPDPPLHPGLPLPGRRLLSNLPRGDKGERTDGTFSRSDFTWDDENDRYICPGGKEMRHTWRTYSDPKRNAPVWKSRNYRALKSDCTGCELKAKCCPNAETRSVHRDKYEIVRDFARQCTACEFNPKAQARRKKSRCSLPTSNASSAWDGFDYGAHAESKTNLLSQPPPRTSGNWQSSSQYCPPQAEAAATS